MIIPGDKITKFSLREPHRRKILEAPVVWGHGGLGEVTFMRTYSRRKEDGSQETWNECVLRVIEGMFSILKTHAVQNRIPWREDRGQRLALEAAQRMLTFKWTPPGRGLQYMGTEAVWIKGGMLLNNCAFVSTAGMSQDDPDECVEPFRFVMDTAMLGTGPGFDTAGAGKVVVLGTDDGEFTMKVEDTREGWVDTVAVAIKAALFGGPYISLDVSDVRAEGAPLVLMGGTSSGPAPLVQCVKGVQAILNELRGQPITSVAITDVMNLIGKCVVSGNIRRTAEIAFASPGDTAFENMKSFTDHAVAVGGAPPDELHAENPADYARYGEHQWTPADGVIGELQAKYADRDWAWKFGGWRWCSNNSIFAKVGMDYAPYGAMLDRSGGDPGFAWLELMRSHGRLKDLPDHRDHRVAGGNPCLEQSLESYEVCNLVENYPAHCDDYWDFQRTLKFSYLYAKTVTLLGTHLERTNEIIIRNRRIGCSLSGAADAIAKIGRSEFFTKWCDEGYRYIGYLDKKYSEWLGVRGSIKTTSMKPSGTVSLVAGVRGPGAHFPKPGGYRLVRLGRTSPVVATLERAGYRVEPAVTDPINTVVAYFPWVVPEGEPTEAAVGIWEQVKMAADLQYWWADNQVSYTATFTQAEADRGEVARVLTAFDGQLKGISFLKSADGNYAQMPFTTAPSAEVAAYAATLKPLNWGSAETAEMVDSFCDGAACEIRR